MVFARNFPHAPPAEEAKNTPALRTVVDRANASISVLSPFFTLLAKTAKRVSFNHETLDIAGGNGTFKGKQANPRGLWFKNDHGWISPSGYSLAAWDSQIFRLECAPLPSIAMNKGEICEPRVCRYPGWDFCCAGWN